MDEIGLKGLRKILQLTSSQVAVAVGKAYILFKLLQLLKVFTSEESQIKLKEAWSHLYGEEFVENLLVKSFERWQPVLKPFSETYEASLQKKKSQSETKRTTDHSNSHNRFHEAFQFHGRFCDLEAGAFDCIAYKSWRSEQEKRKISDRQALAEKLRLSSLLSRESAFHAKRKLLQEKRINASSLEEESHRLQEQLERTNKAELIKASSVAKIVKANRRGVRLAARKVQVDKRNTAKLVDYEKQRDHEKINEQLVEDRRRKASIIKRIRSEEEAWLLQKENYPKPYDPTDIPGHGLLSEMSLAELKERLFLLRQQNSITLADKINDIKCQRQTKSENITELQKLISCFRNAKTTSRKRQKNCEGGKEDLYDSHPELKDLAQLLLKRRRERQELQSAKAL
ncbi:hypothetical protein X801_06509, partial [Opisthorchis viverrini]